MMWAQFLNEEQTHLSFIVSHHSDDDDKVSNFDSSDKPSYDELQDLFNNLHDECIKFYRLYTKQKEIISSLKIKTNTMQEKLDKVKTSPTCNKCNSLTLKTNELNQVICNYEKGQLDLESVLKNDIRMIEVN